MTFSLRKVSVKVAIACVYLMHLALVRELAIKDSFAKFQVPRAFSCPWSHLGAIDISIWECDLVPGDRVCSQILEGSEIFKMPIHELDLLLS